MTRKEHHVGTGMSIIGSGVVRLTTGIGLFTHGHGLVFFGINKRRLGDLGERGCTTAETLEALKPSGMSMMSVPTSTVDKCRPPMSRRPQTRRKHQNIMEV